MPRRIAVVLTGSIFAVTFAFAQDVPASRLDAVQKSGKLRVCTPGDYTPFALAKDGSFEGLDVDLVKTAAKALGAEAVFVKSAWPTLMKDFVEQCDVAVGGISVTLERQKTAFFSQAYMVNGKAPITRCENVAKFQTVADIDKPTVTVIENPGGSNQYGEMAWLLPRGDVAFKAWFDQWLHRAKATGDYDRIAARWLR